MFTRLNGKSPVLSSFLTLLQLFEILFGQIMSEISEIKYEGESHQFDIDSDTPFGKYK